MRCVLSDYDWLTNNLCSVTFNVHVCCYYSRLMHPYQYTVVKC